MSKTTRAAIKIHQTANHSLKKAERVILRAIRFASGMDQLDEAQRQALVSDLRAAYTGLTEANLTLSQISEAISQIVSPPQDVD